MAIILDGILAPFRHLRATSSCFFKENYDTRTANITSTTASTSNTTGDATLGDVLALAIALG